MKKRTVNPAHCKALCESDSLLYKMWSNMLLRCSPSYHEHHIYYDRGIRVCKEWELYKPFRFWAFLNGFYEGLSLDRIDNDLGYSPENCRFVTRQEQARNRRDNLKAPDGRLLVEVAEDPACTLTYPQLVYRHKKGTLAAYLKGVQNEF